MGIKAYMQIKDGHWFDAVCDEGFWYLTITGLIALLGGESLSPALPQIGKWVAVVGAAGLLLTGGRDKKGFGKITGGLSNLYNITSYLSDILSYARLLALGLATGVIAQVVNTMGSLFGGGVMGIIVPVSYTHLDVYKRQQHPHRVFTRKGKHRRQCKNGRGKRAAFRSHHRPRTGTPDIRT